MGSLETLVDKVEGPLLKPRLLTVEAVAVGHLEARTVSLIRKITTGIKTL
jgi:hypothetical protein